MPRPVYILCSETQLQDKTTGMVSHINIFDSVHISQVVPGQPLPPRGPEMLAAFKFVVSASWMREESDDEGQEYDFQIAILPPDPNPEFLGFQGKFVFSTRFHRFDLNIHGPSLTKPGIYWIESRIRKIGSQEWIKQAYPLVAELVNAPEAS